MQSQPKKEKIINEELLTVIEVLQQEMKPRAVLTYQEKDIVFNNAAQSAVKMLKVSVTSTDSQNTTIFHELYNLIQVAFSSSK